MGGGPNVHLGAVQYPPYMQAWHYSSLNANGTVWAESSITTAMNALLTGDSPYAGHTPISAKTIFLGGKELTDFSVPYNLLSDFILLELSSTIIGLRSISQLNSLAVDTSNFATAITQAESSLVESDLNQKKVKKLQTSMREINAVMSSAFVVGKSLVLGEKVNKLDSLDSVTRQEGLQSQIDLTAAAEDCVLLTAVAGLELQRFIVLTVAEFTRLFAVASVELDMNNVEIAAKDSLWDLKAFQYGGNFLGSIKGTAVHVDPGNQDGAKAFNMVARSSAGAGIGFQIGNAICPGWGSLIGAIVGTVAGVAVGATENWG